MDLSAIIMSRSAYFSSSEARRGLRFVHEKAITTPGAMSSRPNTPFQRHPPGGGLTAAW